MRVHTRVDAVLGPKRSFTPEGFLFCEDVPLARTGEQIYLPHELAGIPAGKDGLIRVERHAADVFSDTALASFVGKPVTDDHPPDNLTPETWRDHGKGTILNPRRGVGEQADLMVGDLLIYDANAIKAIMDGKREISCGYTAEYEILGSGRARQFDIIGNHTALVSEGRCGGRCAIGDKKKMPGTVKMTLKDKIAKAIDEAMEGESNPPNAGGAVEHHVHVNVGNTQALEDEIARLQQELAALKAVEESEESEMETSDKSPIMSALKKLQASMDAQGKRIKRLENRDESEKVEESAKKVESADAEEDETDEEKKERLAKEAKAEAKDANAFKASKVLDAAAIPAALQDLKERAELIVPGIRLPALDAKAAPSIVTDSICMQRRNVLNTGMMLPNSAGAIQPLLVGQPAIERMTCDAVHMVFTAVSENMRARNNAASPASQAMGARKVGDLTFSGAITPAEINAKNALFNREVRKGSV